MASDRSAETDAPFPTTAYVILGMLRLGASSGYEIKKAVQVSTRFFWTISEAQIYPMLGRLEEGGLIDGRDAPQGRRRKRVYELTDAGERELVAWLERREPLPFEVRDVALLKLFFGDAASEREQLALVKQLKERSAAELERLRAQVEPAAELARTTGNRLPSLSLTAGIAVHVALIEAAESIGAELEP